MSRYGKANARYQSRGILVPTFGIALPSLKPFNNGGSDATHLCLP